MPKAVLAQEALPAAAGITTVGLLTALPPDVVLGAFMGAVVFLLGTQQRPKWQWMVLFNISFVVGIMAGPMLSEIAAGGLKLIGIKGINVPKGLGAFVTSTCIVNAASWLRDNPTFFFKRKTSGDVE